MSSLVVSQMLMLIPIDCNAPNANISNWFNDHWASTGKNLNIPIPILIIVIECVLSSSQACDSESQGQTSHRVWESKA